MIHGGIAGAPGNDEVVAAAARERRAVHQEQYGPRRLPGRHLTLAVEIELHRALRHPVLLGLDLRVLRGGGRHRKTGSEGTCRGRRGCLDEIAPVKGVIGLAGGLRLHGKTRIVVIRSNGAIVVARRPWASMISVGFGAQAQYMRRGRAATRCSPVVRTRSGRLHQQVGGRTSRASSTRGVALWLVLRAILIERNKRVVWRVSRRAALGMSKTCLLHGSRSHSDFERDVTRAVVAPPASNGRHAEVCMGPRLRGETL